jgi:hypothetical protein
MTRRSRKSDQALPPADEPPSRGAEPALGPPHAPDHACMWCGRGDDAVLGEVTRHRFGFWQHASCRHWTQIEMSRWR